MIGLHDTASPHFPHPPNSKPVALSSTLVYRQMPLAILAQSIKRLVSYFNAYVQLTCRNLLPTINNDGSLGNELAYLNSSATILPNGQIENRTGKIFNPDAYCELCQVRVGLCCEEMVVCFCRKSSVISTIWRHIAPPSTA